MMMKSNSTSNGFKWGMLLALLIMMSTSTTTNTAADPHPDPCKNTVLFNLLKKMVENLDDDAGVVQDMGSYAATTINHCLHKMRTKLQEAQFYNFPDDDAKDYALELTTLNLESCLKCPIIASIA